jgi:hypothetical protein
MSGAQYRTEGERAQGRQRHAGGMAHRDRGPVRPEHQVPRGSGRRRPAITTTSRPYYPVWSLLIVALDVAVIWGLAVYRDDAV